MFQQTSLSNVDDTGKCSMGMFTTASNIALRSLSFCNCSCSCATCGTKFASLLYVDSVEKQGNHEGKKVHA